MNVRSTNEVFENQVALAQSGDLETDLARNLASDCVLLSSDGVFGGRDGARAAARLLDEQVGRTRYCHKARLCHGELAFLEWGASRRIARPWRMARTPSGFAQDTSR